MRKVSTDLIKPGYIAAEDVASPSGNVLVGRGAAITPALGRRLRNWGIDFVCVEGEDKAGESVRESLVSPVRIKSELYDKFLGTLDNAHMRKIFDAACEHIMRQRGEGDAAR
jgi:hypothetical protein